MQPIPTETLPQILQKFALTGTPAEITTYGSGHIHDTFRVKVEEENHPGYILQRLNHEVFKQIPELMQNIILVTRHLQKKKEENPEKYGELNILNLVLTKNSEAYLKTLQGEFWRVFHFIPDSFSYDMVESETQAREGGRAFGEFSAMLADLPGTQLNETIANFHNIEFRLNQLKEAIASDKANRVSSCSQEIDFVMDRASDMMLLVNLGKEGKLPVRITHNDTKFNNVLLNKNDEAISIIDLDTVMPGYILYDFGDSIRTLISTAPEDEPDVTKINLRLNLLEAYTQGFLSQSKAFLTPIELDNLAFSVKLLPYLMGVRFLTDYINGDIYYKIHSTHHNLQRARAQFKLLQKIEESYQEVTQIIDKYL